MKKHCAVYIDGANLHQGVKSLGWRMDYGRFFRWLQDRYHPQKVYLFIGFIEEKHSLYIQLERLGYTLIYKEVTYDGQGKAKGNCDADLVLKVVSDFYEKRFDSAVLVTSDGDFSGLVKFLRNRKVFRILLSPRETCSYLLRKLNIPIVYLATQREKLEPPL
jgi:uncharacterized LabA/DUF88 family protein